MPISIPRKGRIGRSTCDHCEISSSSLIPRAANEITYLAGAVLHHQVDHPSTLFSDIKDDTIPKSDPFREIERPQCRAFLSSRFFRIRLIPTISLCRAMIGDILLSASDVNQAHLLNALFNPSNQRRRFRLVSMAITRLAFPLPIIRIRAFAASARLSIGRTTAG